MSLTPWLLSADQECPHGRDVVSICTLGWPRTPGISVPVLFTSIACGVGFVLPSLIIVVCHVCIFVKVYKVSWRVSVRCCCCCCLFALFVALLFVLFVFEDLISFSNKR